MPFTRWPPPKKTARQSPTLSAIVTLLQGIILELFKIAMH